MFRNDRLHTIPFYINFNNSSGANMENIKDILKNFRIDDSDRENLGQLKFIFEKHKKRFSDEFYKDILKLKGASQFFPDEATIDRHKEALGDWFLRMFSDKHDNKYLMYLRSVGNEHVKIGVSVQFLSAAMCMVRGFAINIIEEEADPEEKRDLISSLNKALDMNLEIITSAYREEELKTSFLSYRVESHLINFGNRFTYGLNLILMVALIVLSVLVVGLFGADIGHIFEGNVERGLISAIGSLLVLWMMIELLGTEIRHLKGEEFSINVFVGVALVAFIRKVLISSFQKDITDETKYFLVASILVLGFIYWLISKTEKRR
jgi:uncharacterized membrane protein (DUF373 family)